MHTEPFLANITSPPHFLKAPPWGGREGEQRGGEKVHFEAPLPFPCLHRGVSHSLRAVTEVFKQE